MGSALSFGENRPAGRHAHALSLDFNDAFVLYDTTFMGIIDSGPSTEFSSNTARVFVGAAGTNTNSWHYTRGATNAADGSCRRCLRCVEEGPAAWCSPAVGISGYAPGCAPHTRSRHPWHT